MMMFQGNSDITGIPLLLLRVGGIYPGTGLYFAVNNVLVGVVGAVALLGVTNGNAGNLEAIVESVQTFLIMLQFWSFKPDLILQFCMLQATMQSCCLRFHHRNIRKLLMMTTKFKHTTNLPPDCQRIVKLGTVAMNSFLIMAACIVIMLNLIPFAVEDELPFACYPPDTWRTTIHIMEAYITAFVYIGMAGTDVIWFSTCLELLVQFRLLVEEVEDLGNSAGNCLRRRFRQVVERHNFLLRITNHLNKIFSQVLFIQSLFAATSCIHLYLAIQGDVSLFNKIKCAGFFWARIFELALFCSCAELVSSALLKVGDSLYDEEWCAENFAPIRKDMVMVMLRSQRPFRFRGCGLVIYNLTVFTKGVKSILSFYTYLSTTKENQNY